MKPLLLFVAIVIALLALPLLFPSSGGPGKEASDAGAPWRIERLPDGTTRVFGLTPGRSTLAEAQRRLGGEPQVALIAAPGERGNVEAYFETVTLGQITGRMVLTLGATDEQREQMLKRARKAEYMEGTTRRIELSAEDLAQAQGATIAAIAFIPSANLDAQIVLQRFGVPAERIRSDEYREHFLYPDKGLDLQLDDKGKEILQYVAPSDFARLRAPLVAEK